MAANVVRMWLKMLNTKDMFYLGRKEIQEDARRHKQRCHKNSLKGKWETVELGMKSVHRKKEMGKEEKLWEDKSRSSRVSVFEQKNLQWFCLYRPEAEHLDFSSLKASKVRVIQDQLQTLCALPSSQAQQTAIKKSCEASRHSITLKGPFQLGIFYNSVKPTYSALHMV